MGSIFYENTGREAFFYEDLDIVFPRHLHKQIEIFYLIEGEVKITLLQQKFLMKAGEILIIFPNLIHSYESVGNTRFYIGLIDIEKLGNNCTVFLDKQCLNPVNKITKFHPEVLHIMKILANQNKKTGSLKREERLYGYFAVMVDYLLECLELQTIQRGNYSETLYLVLNYVLGHYKEEITLDVVGREVGINKYYLSKLFSGKIGYSFPEYLMRIRTEHARELLRTTTKRMDEIACECGFQSESSFFRNFKKITGVTPLKYRKNGNS